MKIIKPYHEILTPIDGVQMLKHVESCGRICYKSEHKITDDSYLSFVKNIIQKRHGAVLEHASISVKFVCDRGVSHEIVRHRLASYCQESTRYCNYAKDDFQTEITVIKPFFLQENTLGYRIWEQSCKDAEVAYFELLNFGCSAQEARTLLPNSLKTEIVMTADLREWRHFLILRTSPSAHPQMREITIPLVVELKSKIPIVFDDIDDIEG